MNSKPINPKVRDYLKYDPETGNIYWTAKPGKKTAIGSVFGNIRRRTGYICGQFKGQDISAHRLAWFLHTGIDPLDQTIDHINGNRSDNRIINLRLAKSMSEQRMNVGALGYYWDKAKNSFCSRFSGKGRKQNLGSSQCPLLARIKYHDFVDELYPHLCIPFVPRKEIKGRPTALVELRR